MGLLKGSMKCGCSAREFKSAVNPLKVAAAQSTACTDRNYGDGIRTRARWSVAGDDVGDRRQGRDAHDVIVVGAGAAGGLAAMLLTESGLRVLLLDAGFPSRWWNVSGAEPDRKNGSPTVGA